MTTDINNAPKYDPTLGFWPTSTGNGYTGMITEEFATFIQANVGKRAFLTEVPENKRGAKGPSFRVKVLKDKNSEESTNRF